MSEFPRKIAIIGCGGSGKSTLAVALGQRLGIPVHHLDQMFWLPGWTHVSKEEHMALQKEVARSSEWIFDGNYGSTMALRLERAEAIIFMDLPRRACLWGVFKRRWSRTRTDPLPGCPEKLDLSFIRWIWTYSAKRRPGIIERLSLMGESKTVVVLRSRKMARAFLSCIETNDWTPGPFGLDKAPAP
ncbi:MAG: AAA family ATPase [Actinomycetota bacterium]